MLQNFLLNMGWGSGVHLRCFGGIINEAQTLLTLPSTSTFCSCSRLTNTIMVWMMTLTWSMCWSLYKTTKKIYRNQQKYTIMRRKKVFNIYNVFILYNPKLVTIWFILYKPNVFTTQRKKIKLNNNKSKKYDLILCLMFEKA